MFRLNEYEIVIKELKSGKTAKYYPYSRSTGTVLDKIRSVKPSDFIIFDTSMMLSYMDYIILVDVSQDKIIERKLSRDSDVRSPNEILNMHKQVQGFYWEDRGKPLKADIVIDNNDYNNVIFRKGNEI